MYISYERINLPLVIFDLVYVCQLFRVLTAACKILMAGAPLTDRAPLRLVLLLLVSTSQALLEGAIRKVALTKTIFELQVEMGHSSTTLRYH